jgi:hypothetical protein
MQDDRLLGDSRLPPGGHMIRLPQPTPSAHSDRYGLRPRLQTSRRSQLGYDFHPDGASLPSGPCPGAS